MALHTPPQAADNGVNVDALLGARAALTETPIAGQFTWRVRSEWLNGAHSRATISGFFGLGAEHERARDFTIECDHPAVFAAADAAATPLEVVLAALAGCLSAGVASVAQHRGIQLRSVNAIVEGDMDVSGVLGANPEVRNGFNAIRIRFEIDADASDEDIAALVAQSQRRSAVFDVITNPSFVTVSVA